LLVVGFIDDQSHVGCLLFVAVSIDHQSNIVDCPLFEDLMLLVVRCLLLVVLIINQTFLLVVLRVIAYIDDQSNVAVDCLSLVVLMINTMLLVVVVERC
jgi:hypothetical protein